MTPPFFLLLALAITVVGCTVVYLRQRGPRSVESGIATFRREMDALAARPGPDLESTVQPTATGLESERSRRRRPRQR